MFPPPLGLLWTGGEKKSFSLKLRCWSTVPNSVPNINQQKKMVQMEVPVVQGGGGGGDTQALGQQGKLGAESEVPQIHANWPVGMWPRGTYHTQSTNIHTTATMKKEVHFGRNIDMRVNDGNCGIEP